MPTDNSTNPGPAPTPDLPITLHVDGDIPAVDLVRRLYRAGLELRQGPDDEYCVLVLAEKDTGKELRARLFEAAGICAAVRCALTSNTETDADALQDALSAAERILDDAAAELEGST